MDEIKSIPRNQYLGMLADALGSAKDSTGVVGDFLLGDAPRTLDQWSYGFNPVRMGRTDQGLAGALNGMRVDPGLMDVAGVAGMAPGIGRGAQWAGREGLRMIDDAMLGGGNQALARALNGVSPRRIIDAEDAPTYYHRSAQTDFDITPGYGRFGSIFGAPKDPGPNYGDNLHAFRVNGPVLENEDIVRALDSGNVDDFLKQMTGSGGIPESTLEDAKWLMGNEFRGLTPSDAPNGTSVDDLYGLFNAIDESDLYAEIQRARAALAGHLKGAAVQANDEFDGRAVQLLDARRVNDQ